MDTERDTLIKFLKDHHEFCIECDGTGKIYKHGDPTTFQWAPCPYKELLDEIGG